MKMSKAGLKILVADDDDSIRFSLKKVFEKENHDFVLVQDGMQALEVMETTTFDLAFVDLKMPGIGGMDVLQSIRRTSPATDVVIITGYGTVETAVKAIKYGAYDYISKPFSLESIRQIIDKIVQKNGILKTSTARPLKFNRDGQVETIIGESPRMMEIYELVQKVAPTDSTVLITGDTGTGKELIAKAIHFNSLRKDKPFLTVDCSSLVETLFESELFGHVKGSFTGAVATKHGSFELANGGTFFFDEIGNISLNIQAKILRAIQEKEIKRVGATDTIKVDVRVIAATNKDLRQAVEEGTFRDDLFYRISVIPIHLPALKERRIDVMTLANHFLAKYNHKRKRDFTGFSETVKQIFMQYAWPGNVRELENVVERAVVIEDCSEITPSSLPSHLRNMKKEFTVEDENIKSLEQIERNHIRHVLEQTKWNRSRSASLLGIDRKTLYDKIKKYNLKQEC